MSVDTDLAIIGPAAAESAALLATALGLSAEPGSGYDIWADGAPAGSPVLERDARAWTAPLLGPAGPCGDLSLVVAPGTAEPSAADLAEALAGAVNALAAACGADRAGNAAAISPSALTQARPGEQAIAVPLVSDGAEVALVVLVLPASDAAAELPHLDPSPGTLSARRSIAALGEVEMTVTVELGRTKIAIKDLLDIHNGAVVQLDRVVTQPVDILVQGTLIARGEVVVVDDSFAVRVTELLTGD